MTVIGRQNELELISQHLKPGEVVVLSGPSGIGKTTTARRFLELQTEPVLDVDCFGMDSTDIAIALTHVLDAGPTQLRPIDLWLRASEVLAHREVRFLLLDDVRCEHDDFRNLFTHWNGSILVTSILATGNKVIPLTPLNDHAFEVFESAALSEDLSFRIDDHESIQKILAEIQGHPLGLALAGRFAAISSPKNVLNALQRNSLTDQSRPERHRSTWNAAEFTWNQLTVEQKSLVYAMALFERPLRLSALPVTVDQPIERVVEDLRALVRAGIVARGEFQRPLQLFCEFAKDAFPMEFSDTATLIQDKIVAEASRAAQMMPRGLHDTPELQEQPSFWRFVIESRAEEIEPKLLAPILSAWLRYVGVRDRASGRSEDSQIASLLEKTNDSDNWLQAARVHLFFDFNAACGFVERAVQTAQSPQELHDAKVFQAYNAATAQPSESLRLFDEAYCPDFDSSIVAFWEAEICIMAQEPERAKSALGRLDLDRLSPNNRAAYEHLLAELEPPIEAERRTRLALKDPLMSPSKRVSLLLANATILAIGLNRFDDAFQKLEECSKLAQHLKSPRVISWIQMRTALALLHAGEFTKARKFANDTQGPSSPVMTIIVTAALWQEGQHQQARENWRVLKVEYPKPHSHFSTLWHFLDFVIEGDRNTSDPRLDDVFEAISIVNSPGDTNIQEVIAAWPLIQKVIQYDSNDVGFRQARLFIDRRVSGAASRISKLQTSSADIAVLNDFSAYCVRGTWFDLSKHSVGMAILQALIEAEHPLDFQALGDHLYPGEIVLEEALVNRINVHISKLRGGGLKPFLAKKKEGFVLEATIYLEDEPEPPPGELNA